MFLSRNISPFFPSHDSDVVIAHRAAKASRRGADRDAVFTSPPMRPFNTFPGARPKTGARYKPSGNGRGEHAPGAAFAPTQQFGQVGAGRGVPRGRRGSGTGRDSTRVPDPADPWVATQALGGHFAAQRGHLTREC